MLQRVKESVKYSYRQCFLLVFTILKTKQKNRETLVALLHCQYFMSCRTYLSSSCTNCFKPRGNYMYHKL
jgi:hypothetical protein